MGKVPTISINKTDGCQVFLSKDSLGCEVISAKSSEMNVLVPKEDGEFVSISPPHKPEAFPVFLLHSLPFHLPACRASSRFPSSTRPCGTATNSSPLHQKTSARRGGVRSPSHAPKSPSTFTPSLAPVAPPIILQRPLVTDLPPHQLTFTL